MLLKQAATLRWSSTASEITAKEKFHGEDQGLDEGHCVFAAVLYRNTVAPEQVLIDAGCDCFQHEKAASALAAAANTFMFPDDNDSDYD
jgi:hypothetical protein